MEKADYKSGEVRQILSGNGVLLAGPIDVETGVPRTKYLTLSGIQCAEYSTQDKEAPRQQPLGYKAREYLRSLILGKKVDFAVELKIKDSNDKVIGHILYNGEDVAIQLLKQGLAQLRGGSKAMNQQKQTIICDHSRYEEAENFAKSKKLGLWGDTKKEVIPFEAVNPQQVAEKMVGKRLVGCTVEDVGGVFVFYLYSPELKGLLKCSFGDIYSPNQTPLFQKKAKWYLDGLIYQQNAEAVVVGYDEKMQAVRVDLYKGSLDVKRDLLASGFFRLAQNAFQLTLNQNRYNELRDSQSQAELKGVGIWKDTQKKAPQSQTQSSTFDAKLIEVHSGDSLTVLNEKTKEQVRVYLANVRAPTYTQKEQKPFGYEAKEFLRKHGVGKQVTVEVEYEKKIAPKPTGDDDDRKPQELHMIFVNVILQDKDEKVPNLSVQIVQAGLATVQPPRGDDGCSRHLDDLRNAQEAATKAQRNLHGKNQKQPPKFNDYSLPGKGQLAKQAFSFLKDEKKLTGTVDLVLNGSRFKIRFDQSACYGIVVLSGVKCLPNDPNFPDFQKFSNLALQFARQNILQRDVEIELDAVDKKGIFHGHLFLNKSNFAQRILSNGLGVTFDPLGQNKYSADFDLIEKEAKARKDGLWGLKDLNLAVIKGDEEDAPEVQMKALSGEGKYLVTEIIDANEIYMQDTSSKYLSKIEDEMEIFAPSDNNKLVAPLKKGTSGVAKFSADNRWYRAKVSRDLTQKGKEARYEVFFIDFGNYDNVYISDFRKCPNQVVAVPPQALRTALSYVRGPSGKNPLTDEAALFVRNQIYEKEIIVKLDHTDGNTTYVTVYLTKEKVPERTLNYLVLTKGYAQLDSQVSKTIIFKQPPCPHASFKEANDKAKSETLGMWNFRDDEDD